MNSTTPGASTNTTGPNMWITSNLENCMFSINVLFGLPTHSYIIWLIVKGTGSGVASEFFNLNLSVCEIGACLDFVFFVLGNWIFFLLLLALFFQGFAITGRALFQCLICVERYLAVVHPVTFLKYKPLRYRVICCTVAWIIIFGSCLVCMFTLMSNNINAHTWFFSIQFILFLSIQLFCLVAVLRALKQSGPGERWKKREEENHMKRRAFHLILITTVNMVITYVPIIISGVFIILKKHYDLAYWAPGVVCFVLAGFVQPVLYLHRADEVIPYFIIVATVTYDCDICASEII
ncbi:uracil nucleotide/cysteinyl leukotriene receptor-like [Onychostoma macrolepis]|uniref:uracil nucleotide/cysteinyl leukotriene receptor-like n=1 Tax=Onychostoma macrolepis TaxID=369639 RepID=UPI00272B867C|nr:uracil nucleotide/cysteinyl leukotriene receptor-like [Onychostoma macrolepis]